MEARPLLTLHICQAHFSSSHSYQEMSLAVEDVTTVMEGQVRDAGGGDVPGQGTFSGPEITDFLRGYMERNKHTGVCLVCKSMTSLCSHFSSLLGP